jgi:CheY-like chemotaxis protein
MAMACGCECDVVHNGADAAIAAAARDYSLVFMDLVMPIESGSEATIKIRSVAPRDDAPIIIGMLSYEHHDMRQQCISSGMDHVVVKPVNRKLLTSLLKELRKGSIHNSEDQPHQPQHKIIVSDGGQLSRSPALRPLSTSFPGHSRLKSLTKKPECFLDQILQETNKLLSSPLNTIFLITITIISTIATMSHSHPHHHASAPSFQIAL